jgi:hypothetical protein
MEKNKSQTKQARADREPIRVDDQANLTRAAHKIAWTRMNGRNDAQNPFAQGQTGRSAREERRE